MRLLLVASLCLLAVPVFAAQPAPSQPAVAPSASHDAPSFVAALLPAPLAEGTTSVCIANCWDGSTVTCTGSSCTATDSSCNTVRGNCWSNAEGTKNCPPCNCSPTCSELDGTSCVRGTRTCYEPYLNCHPFTCSCNNHQWLCP